MRAVEHFGRILRMYWPDARPDPGPGQNCRFIDEEGNGDVVIESWEVKDPEGNDVPRPTIQEINEKEEDYLQDLQTNPPKAKLENQFSELNDAQAKRIFLSFMNWCEANPTEVEALTRSHPAFVAALKKIVDPLPSPDIRR